jgi:hypothetical protein
MFSPFLQPLFSACTNITFFCSFWRCRTWPAEVYCQLNASPLAREVSCDHIATFLSYLWQLEPKLQEKY